MYDEHTEMARNCNVFNDHQALSCKIGQKGGLNGYESFKSDCQKALTDWQENKIS